MFPILLLLAAGQAAAQTSTPTCANWPAECGPLDPSAPFLRTPRVELLSACKGTSPTPATCGAERWSHTFTGAAHFPITRFGPAGEPVETEGLVIYEGMKLTVDRDSGHYDLSFTATAPNVPVTVRLQLGFSKDMFGPNNDLFRLTLPPIVIEPSYEAAKTGYAGGTTVSVNHRGDSAVLHQRRQTVLVLPPWVPYPLTPPGMGTQSVDPGWKVRRTGTARFGMGVPTADDLSR